jgi:hypothetical protein
MGVSELIIQRNTQHSEHTRTRTHKHCISPFTRLLTHINIAALPQQISHAARGRQHDGCEHEAHPRHGPAVPGTSFSSRCTARTVRARKRSQGARSRRHACSTFVHTHTPSSHAVRPPAHTQLIVSLVCPTLSFATPAALAIPRRRRCLALYNAQSQSFVCITRGQLTASLADPSSRSQSCCEAQPDSIRSHATVLISTLNNKTDREDCAAEDPGVDVL